MKKNKLVLVIFPFIVFGLILLIIPFSSVQAGLWDMQQEALGETGTTFDAIGETDDPGALVVEIIKIFLGFIGLIVIVILIWGGFRWMSAGGNDDDVRQAKKIVIRAVIGLAIIIASYAITEFVAYFIEDALDGW
jgi:hypothetical protein